VTAKVKVENAIWKDVIMHLCAFAQFSNTGETSKALKEVLDSWTAYLETAQKTLKFPTATTSNASVVNSLMSLTTHLLKRSLSSKSTSTSTASLPSLKNALSKYTYTTYHNSNVMKLWCMDALCQGAYDEARATFKTFLDYTRDHATKHGGCYDDVVDVLQTYVYVVQELIQHVGEETVGEVREWYADAVGLAECIQSAAGGKVEEYTSALRNMLVDVYWGFAKIAEGLLEFEYDAFSAIDTVVIPLNQCVNMMSGIELGKSHGEYTATIWYKHSFYMHKSGQHSIAMSSCKAAIKAAPNDIKYLNYYVKLLSGDEDRVDEALTVSQQIVESLKVDGVTMNSHKWKKDAVEAHLIFLTLLGDAAIEALPAFFAFVNTVFGESTTTDTKHLAEKKVARTTNGHTQVNGNVMRHEGHERQEEACAPCGPSPSSQDGRVKRLLHIHTRKPSTASSATTSARVSESKSNVKTKTKFKTKFKSTSTTDSALQQHLWLSLSRVLETCGDLAGALECVSEAERFAIDGVSASASVAVKARRGCVLHAMGDPVGAALLRGAVESAFDSGLSGRPEMGVCEAVVGALQCRGSSSSSSSSSLAVGSSVVRALLRSVFWGDCAALRILKREVEEEEEQEEEDAELSGWHGLLVLEQ
jgi:tetratricopeptide (TPR) repeat protein